MKSTRIIMGMPVTVEVVDANALAKNLEMVFQYFTYVDEKFSTYKSGSEISKINRKEISKENFSDEMNEVFILSEETKQATKGYFDIKTPKGSYDPSGLVKGWAINNAAKILENIGFKNFYVEAGGDVQTFGMNHEGKSWSIGIKNPFDQNQIVKVAYLSGQGMATSGTYVRGQHIYNPHLFGGTNPKRVLPSTVAPAPASFFQGIVGREVNSTTNNVYNYQKAGISDIVSLTVIGPNVYEADRFATAAFAMGKAGIRFIEELPGLEGYMIDNSGMATMTSGFQNFTTNKSEIRIPKFETNPNI